eukprot:3191902-Prorocentrum_lima.AAC.1
MPGNAKRRCCCMELRNMDRTRGAWSKWATADWGLRPPKNNMGDMTRRDRLGCPFCFPSKWNYQAWLINV